MRKIAEEEYKKLKFKARYLNPIFKELAGLKKGEHFLIEKSDWTLKSAVGAYIQSSSYMKNSALQGFKFKVRSLSNNSGWVVTKIK